MDPANLLCEDVYASIQSTRVISDVQLVHFRNQLAIYKSLRLATASMEEQQAAKTALSQHAARKAAAAKNSRTPTHKRPTTPSLRMSQPVKLDIVVQDSEPLSEPEASQEESEVPSASDDESHGRGSHDSNLATDEDPDTSDMCDDSDDGGRRKRGRIAHVATSSGSDEEAGPPRPPSPARFQPAILVACTKPLRWPHLYKGDQPCDVCGDGDCDEGNALVLCDGCDVAVHQSCYGVRTIPEGDWFCDACTAKLNHDASHCAVCPVVGGALRQVTSMGEVQPPPQRRGRGRARPPQLWVHAACALWNTEITFGNPDQLCDVRLDGLSAARAALKCTVCGQQGGGVVQCGFPSCRVPFHVLCGRAKGFVYDFADTGGEVPEPMGFCATHSMDRFAAGRARVLKRIITDEQEELRRLEAGAATAGNADDHGADNEYEQQRRRNMARNAQMLSALLDKQPAY